MKSLDEYMDIMVESLKNEYLKDTTALWAYPCLMLVRNDGEVKVVDGHYSNQDLMIWGQTNLDVKRAKYIIIGRMVVKYSTIINPATGKPNIIEKAIMITGKSLNNNRTKLMIFPCKEHKDYRDLDTINKENKNFDPSVKGADVSAVKSDETGKYSYYLTAKLGTPIIKDTKKGDVFLSDPILKAIGKDVPNIDADSVQDASNPINKLI